jgi:hypothetical protein
MSGPISLCTSIGPDLGHVGHQQDAGNTYCYYQHYIPWRQMQRMFSMNCGVVHGSTYAMVDGLSIAFLFQLGAHSK